MADIIDRDPIRCEERITKRRELLKTLYEENKYELLNPALIQDDKPELGECSELLCLLKNKEVDHKEKKLQITIKILAIVFSVSIIVMLTLIALLIGGFGK